jgi:hypothetical protein
MKLRILILSIFGTFIFNSCTTDSNSSTSTSQNLDPNTLLPKQIMITEPLNDRFFKCNFFYNGNKIDYISYSSSYFDYQSQTIVTGSGNVNYTYNGNLINKIESDNGNTSYNFTYQNGKISTCNFVSGNLENNFNIQFQYGSNGSVTRIITYPNNPNITTPLVESLNNFSNGIPYSISLDNKECNIQYTGSNSVYKNITGFNEVLSNMFFCDLIGSHTGSTTTPDNPICYFTGGSGYNNIPDWFLKLSPIYNYDFISNYGGYGGYNYSYSYIYNEINFPTSYEVQQSGVVYSGGYKEYGTIIYY